MPEFDFEVGDRVEVKVRENGTSGPIVAKFEAEVAKIDQGEKAMHSPKVLLEVPWGGVDGRRLRFKSYEAEFEVIDDA